MKKMDKISIVGVGYVGLPLVSRLAKNANLLVMGFDISERRIKSLKKGVDQNEEICLNDIFKNKNVSFTNNFEDLSDTDTYIVTVPTPIDQSKRPDFGPILQAAEYIGKSISKNNEISKEILIILESTVYPGATEEILKPKIFEHINTFQKSNTQRKISFGYSPERLSPGRGSKKVNEITKIISADSKESLANVRKIYEEYIGCKVYAANSIKIAESAKLLENTQRDLNIALMNECVHIFSRLGISTNEVIDAASTKWNFMLVRPGLVGGHCIGVDPYYLSAKAQLLDFNPEVVLAGRTINDGFARWIAKECILKLFKDRKGKEKYKALIYGLTFKADCNDIRNSKSFEIINLLKKYGVEVFWHDPLVSQELEKKINIRNRTHNLIQKDETFDLIIICVGHSSYSKLNENESKEFLEKALIVYDIPGVVEAKIKNLLRP